LPIVASSLLVSPLVSSLIAPLIAVGAIAVIGACSVLALIALIAIIWAPWKRVRRETALDADTESRLLLGENPKVVANDLEQNQKDSSWTKPTDEI